MVSDEECEGAAEMNAFLRKHALDQAKRGISRTFVLRDEDSEEPDRVIAFYTTSVGHLQPDDLPKVVSPHMTIPVVLLQRLAVDRQFQRLRIGTKLFVHFLVTLVDVAGSIGVYALVLEPLNDRVCEFYARFGLLPLPGDESRMYARVKDIQAWLSAHGTR